ncbi:hypothetical protein AAMO2058_000588400 [Amorphochlora amoebiformis]|uniref:Uncharacterized protein n=1 Tax=Amorphochlora amoebiformis TaxID=1561963 RepID=A0A7S0CQL8_9EUKA|mmetsp:Transcript_11735/g.18641  ORF Transcript_11735/g.18641 Transcript_11735/m.18641 type:complete len:242 (+) Transcript_11735:62-787(+)
MGSNCSCRSRENELARHWKIKLPKSFQCALDIFDHLVDDQGDDHDYIHNLPGKFGPSEKMPEVQLFIKSVCDFACEANGMEEEDVDDMLLMDEDEVSAALADAKVLKHKEVLVDIDQLCGGIVNIKKSQDYTSEKLLRFLYKVKQNIGIMSMEEKSKAIGLYGLKSRKYTLKPGKANSKTATKILYYFTEEGSNSPIEWVDFLELLAQLKMEHPSGFETFIDDTRSELIESIRNEEQKAQY